MVANLMSWERIRHVPVEDKEHNLIGLVTYRAVLKFLTGGGVLADTPVSEIMRTDVTTVGLETATIEALRLMRRLRIGCLPVVQDGRLVGILTEEDFMTIASRLLEQRLGEA
jgi:CBS domain-containing protein